MNRRFSPLFSLLLPLISLGMVLAPFASAHKVSAVSVVAEFTTENQEFKVELAMDVDPSGDPTIDDQIPPEEAARIFATESLEIYFDDQLITLTPEIRVLTESDENTPIELQRKKVVGTLKGTYPGDAENFLLRVTETTEAAVVMATIKDGKPARRLQVLYPGEFSNPVSLTPVMEGDPFEKAGDSSPSPSGEPSPSDPAPEKTAVETHSEGGPPSSESSESLGKRIGRGFSAILPSGLEFWAFMLAMFALSLRSKPLGWQVGLYTIAHSLALALAAFKLVVIPLTIVAPIAAISALVLAIDNLVSQKLQVWRCLAVFGFGLFHGFALARFLPEPNPFLIDRLPTVIGFNLGIELAQFTLLALVSIIAVFLYQKKWFRPYFLVPLNVILGGIALFRFVEVLWLNG